MGAVDEASRAPARWSGLRESFGVDLGPGFAAIARLRGRRTEILFAGDPGNDPEAWKQALSKLPAGGRATVAAAMPASAAILRWIDTPLGQAKSRRVLPSLLDVELPFPVEECTCDFIDLHPQGSGTRALAVGARDLDLTTRIRELEQAGVQAELLDHEALALWKASGTQAPEPRAVAYLGDDRCVVVFGNGDRLDSAQSIRMGLDADNAEELARRINRVIKARAESAEAPRTWTWCGPRTVSEPRTDEAGDLPRLGRLQAAMPSDLRFDTLEDPASALARSLAQRALTPGPDACNLRAGAHAHEGLRERQGRARRGTAYALSATGLLLIAASFAWDRVLEDRENEVKNRIVERTRALTGFEKIQYGREVQMVENRIREQDAAGQAFADSVRASGISELARILELGRQHGLRYEELDWKPGGMTLNGTAHDWDACDLLRAHFESRDYVVQLTRRDADAQERVPFTCQAEAAP